MVPRGVSNRCGLGRTQTCRGDNHRRNMLTNGQNGDQIHN